MYLPDSNNPSPFEYAIWSDGGALAPVAGVTTRTKARQSDYVVSLPSQNSVDDAIALFPNAQPDQTREIWLVDKAPVVIDKFRQAERFPGWRCTNDVNFQQRARETRSGLPRRRINNAEKPMKNELIQTLTETFEGHVQETETAWSTGWPETYSTCWAIPSGTIFSTLSPKPRRPARCRATISHTILPMSAKWSNIGTPPSH